MARYLSAPLGLLLMGLVVTAYGQDRTSTVSPPTPVQPAPAAPATPPAQPFDAATIQQLQRVLAQMDRLTQQVDELTRQTGELEMKLKTGLRPLLQEQRAARIRQYEQEHRPKARGPYGP